MRKSRVNRLIYLAVTLISLLITVTLVVFSSKAGEIELKAGEACQEDIYAPRAVTDHITTTQSRQIARDNTPDKYDYNAEIGKHSVESITALFDKAAEINAEIKKEEQLHSLLDILSDKQKKAQELKEISPIEISTETAQELITAEFDELGTMRQSISLVQKYMENPEKPVSDKEKAQNECEAEINSYYTSLSNSQRNALCEIVSKVIVTNSTYNAEETKKAKDAAAAEIEETVYQKDQIIIRKGEVATEAQIQVLKELGMLKGSSPISVTYTVGILFIVLISYAILFFFFRSQFRKQLETISIISLAGLLIILIAFYGSRSSFITTDMLPVLPFGIFPGIAAIFSSASLTAIITNLIFSIFCGIILEANWSLTICLVLAGTMAAYSFSTVKRRSHLLPAAVASAVFYALAFCGMSFIEDASAARAFAAFGKGLLGGTLSGLITIGSIQFFEWLFNATTPMKLSELTNPENKLLKKLLVEAPGSYHHALTVANISEIAARSIKADSLLARVGAYYHDIGKIRHPLYFKENQYDQNAHDTLTPEQSSAVIISHVTDGIEIAKKYRLPQVVSDIISQHHGTTTTGYFLIRARELDPEVDPKKFTYPGPIPQTKEAAIVMLADSCEAAVRSIDEKTEAKIEAMVRKIATERVNSGQFSQCNMTFAELELVIKVITKTLGGYFHERIKYE